MKHKTLLSLFLIIPIFTIAQTLEIFPQDTTIQVGNAVQFSAQYVDTLGSATDTSVTWSVKKDLIGPISEDGVLLTFFPGQANIMAKLDSMTAKTGISVVDTTSDSTGVNTVTIIRKMPNGAQMPSKTINEGEKYVLGGFPHPANIINGCGVYFPMGSLHEDITLEITIPKFAKIGMDSVEFANNIINGIQFDVYVKDSLIKPYYFDKPVSVALPFKRGIIKKLGIKIEDMTLYFADDSLNLDSLGISQVVVDSAENRIFGLIAHFSSLVVHEKEGITAIKSSGGKSVMPDHFALNQNYPNPFNPATTIGFSIPEQTFVELTVMDILGKKVRTLVRKNLSAGFHTYKFDASRLASGVYLYMLKTKDVTLVKKMLLIR